MREAIILSAVRLPAGRLAGALKSFDAPELGGMVVREAVRRAGIDPTEVDEVVLGNSLSTNLGPSPARQAATQGGLAVKTAAFTVGSSCGSALKAVMLAVRGILAGEHDIVVAGGMESLSNCPLLSDPSVVAGWLNLDWIWESGERLSLGHLAELNAEKHAISRDEVDRYASESHRKAVTAIRSGKLEREILSVRIPESSGSAVAFEFDETPRQDVTLEWLAEQEPTFKQGGSITVGNSPRLSDGAGALVLASVEAARRLGVKPLARVAAQAVGGADPRSFVMAPVEAVRRLFLKTGWDASIVDGVELDETAPVEAIVFCRELGLNPEKLGPHGGATAFGHQIGAGGARVLATLVHGLRDRGGTCGVATSSSGAGIAYGLAVEMI